jgi:hypothetical protein
MADSEPPFFRCDEPWHGCDHITEGDDTCCDDWSDYLITWKIASYDAGCQQYSSACKAHIAAAPRDQMISVATHPRVLAAVSS